MRPWQRWTLVAVLVVLAVLFFVVGFIYGHKNADKLPHLLGRVKAPAHFHRTKRELASFVVGAFFLLLALVAAFVGRGPRDRELMPPPSAPQDGGAPATG